MTESIEVAAYRALYNECIRFLEAKGTANMAPDRVLGNYGTAMRARAELDRLGVDVAHPMENEFIAVAVDSSREKFLAEMAPRGGS